MLLKKGGNPGSDEEKADFSQTVRFTLRRARAVACGNPSTSSGSQTGETLDDMDDNHLTD